MRTKALLCLAALAASAATCLAQNVYSLNVVGYVNKDVPAGQLTLVANPLAGTNNTVGSVLGGVGGQLPEGSQVYLWNGTGYNIGTRDDFETTGWGGGFEATDISPGKGFFVKTPSAAKVTFVGEVLQATNSNMHIGTGYQLLGSLVPVAGPLDAASKFPAADGDQVYIWTGASFNVFTADSLNEPAPWGANPPTLGLAEGFFSRKAAAADWVRNFTVPTP